MSTYDYSPESALAAHKAGLALSPWGETVIHGAMIAAPTMPQPAPTMPRPAIITRAEMESALRGIMEGLEGLSGSDYARIGWDKINAANAALRPPVLPKLRLYAIRVEYEYTTGPGGGISPHDETHSGEEEFLFDAENVEDAIACLRPALRKCGLEFRDIVTAAISGSKGRHKLSDAALRIGGMK